MHSEQHSWKMVAMEGSFLTGSFVVASPAPRPLDSALLCLVTAVRGCPCPDCPEASCSYRATAPGILEPQS